MRRVEGHIEDATDDKLPALQQGCECPPDLRGNTKGQPETEQRKLLNLFNNSSPHTSPGAFLTIMKRKARLTATAAGTKASRAQAILAICGARPKAARLEYQSSDSCLTFCQPAVSFHCCVVCSAKTAQQCRKIIYF